MCSINSKHECEPSKVYVGTTKCMWAQQSVCGHNKQMLNINKAKKLSGQTTCVSNALNIQKNIKTERMQASGTGNNNALTCFQNNHSYSSETRDMRKTTPLDTC